jgi:hypothetical protein
MANSPLDPGYPWYVTSGTSPPTIMTPPPRPDGAIGLATDGYTANFYQKPPATPWCPIYATTYDPVTNKWIAGTATGTST